MSEPTAGPAAATAAEREYATGYWQLDDDGDEPDEDTWPPEPEPIPVERILPGDVLRDAGGDALPWRLGLRRQRYLRVLYSAPARHPIDAADGHLIVCDGFVEDNGEPDPLLRRLFLPAGTMISRAWAAPLTLAFAQWLSLESWGPLAAAGVPTRPRGTLDLAAHVVIAKRAWERLPAPPAMDPLYEGPVLSTGLTERTATLTLQGNMPPDLLATFLRVDLDDRGEAHDAPTGPLHFQAWSQAMIGGQAFGMDAAPYGKIYLIGARPARFSTSRLPLGEDPPAARPDACEIVWTIDAQAGNHYLGYGTEATPPAFVTDRPLDARNRHLPDRSDLD